MNAEPHVGSEDLVGIPESRAGILTLLDYASLMRGLELLPERRADVLAHFELDEALGQPEIDRWNAWLASHPSDQAECASMADRMTAYWKRWDASTPVRAAVAGEEEPVPDVENPSLELMAKLSGGLETLPDRRDEVFAALGARTHDQHVDLKIALDRTVSAPELDVRRFLALRTESVPFWQRWLSPPTLSLVDCARLVLDLDRAQPKDVPVVYRAHRLDRVTAERELSLWKQRIAESPDEAARYAQVRATLMQAPGPTPATPRPMAPAAPRLEPIAAPQTARAVVGTFFTRTPVVAQPVAVAPTLPSYSPTVAQPPNVEPIVVPRRLQPTPATEPPPIGLLEYTVLCLQLELDEARAELHYRRLGLVDQAHRDHVHGYWQERFSVDPSARKEWIDQARRLRANWQGSRK